MVIEWDEEKRLSNLVKHQLDFRDAQIILNSTIFEIDDTRANENRILAFGYLKGIVVIVCYTIRHENTLRIISMRKATNHEEQNFLNYLRD